MNIAEIKERYNKESAIYLYCKDGDSEESEVTNDISYLLSIINTAEKSLKEISFITRYSDHIVHKSAHNLSESALKSIQGEG